MRPGTGGLPSSSCASSVASMKKARKTPEEKLAELDEALAADAAGRGARLGVALRDKHYRVVAKAARLAAEGLHYELVPALVDAFRRFLDNAVKADPTCFAKKALLRALVELDCDDVAFYQEALGYRQMEPVWGGSTDTAVDVRASAAMGLVASGYSRALVDVVTLLYDKEHDARAGAARAIACGNPREAELLLRAKILAGDAEAVVLGECFAGLLAAAPEDSVDFVARYLDAADEEVREQAALALGGSKLDAARHTAPRAAAGRGAEPQRARRRLARRHRRRGRPAHGGGGRRGARRVSVRREARGRRQGRRRRPRRPRGRPRA